MTRAVDNILMMRFFQRFLETKPIGLSLDELLVKSASFESTDPRDRIYGLLALSTEEARRNILVDYGGEIKERNVSIRATRFTLIKDSAFQLLEFAGIGYPDSQERPAEWPSWVPWWSLDNMAIGDRRRAIMRSESYKTALHLKSHVVRGGDEDSLIQIEGSLIDEIAAMSPIWFPEFLSLHHTTSDEEMIKHVPRFLELVEAACEVAGLTVAGESRDNWQTPIWRTLCHNSVVAPDQRTTYFEECGVQITQAASELRELIQSGYDMYQIDRPKLVRHIATLTERLDLVLRRSWCITQRGHNGILPPLAQKGDQICIFSGAPNPFVLRLSEGSSAKPQSNQRYRLIGVCHVDGIMMGELREINLQLEMIKLI